MASDNVTMTEPTLPLFGNPAVVSRTSAATRRVLEERARPSVAAPRYLSAELYVVLEGLVSAILPQAEIGTGVDIAAVIDKRLADGKGSGWRFAQLPADGEAYTRGLKVFATMLEQTPFKSFEQMPVPSRESYLRCVANGDVDWPAAFALSKWLLMVKTDVVRAWLSHPAAMQAIEYFGFADGASGLTDGPTSVEGWVQITPNRSQPFEKGLVQVEDASGVDGGAA